MKSVFPSLGIVVCAVLVVALAPQLSLAGKQAKGAKQAEVVAGEMDPHHGYRWPFDILIKVTNLK